VIGPVSPPPAPLLEVLVVEPVELAVLVEPPPPLDVLALLVDPLEVLLPLDAGLPLELLLAPVVLGELLLPHAAIPATRTAGLATSKSERRVKEV